MKLFLDANVLFTAAHDPRRKAAMACRADYLVTGDLNDFSSFMNERERTFGVCVLTVAAFLAG